MRLSDASLVPSTYLCGAVFAALALVLLQRRHARRRRVRWMVELARSSRMNFSPVDRFDLTERLRRLPEWAPQSIELVVTDVLYAAEADARRFIATATYRRTLDERPRRFVFSCVERLPANVLDEASVWPVGANDATPQTYAAAVARVEATRPATG